MQQRPQVFLKTFGSGTRLSPVQVLTNKSFPRMFILFIHVFVYLPLSMWTGFKLGRVLRKRREEGLNTGDKIDLCINLVGYGIVAAMVIGYDVNFLL